MAQASQEMQSYYGLGELFIIFYQTLEVYGLDKTSLHSPPGLPPKTSPVLKLGIVVFGR